MQLVEAGERAVPPGLAGSAAQPPRHLGPHLCDRLHQPPGGCKPTVRPYALTGASIPCQHASMALHQYSVVCWTYCCILALCPACQTPCRSPTRSQRIIACLAASIWCTSSIRGLSERTLPTVVARSVLEAFDLKRMCSNPGGGRVRRIRGPRFSSKKARLVWVQQIPSRHSSSTC